MKRTMGILLDTETCNLLDCPLLYDFAFAVIDLHHNVYAKFRVVLTDVFYDEPDLMNTAYYAEKIPQYYKAIENHEVLTMNIWELKRFLREICEYYEVSFACAHNARFDYLSTNTTIRYLTKSKARYLLPYGIEWWDTLKMASDTICKQKKYRKFCEKNGYICKNGQLRKTAEVLYRYISKDNDFAESHTALDDVLIECEIFWKCFDQHKPMTRKLWKDRV